MVVRKREQLKMKMQSNELSDERRADVARFAAELRPPEPLQGNVRPFARWANVATYRVRLNGAQLLAFVEVECIDAELWAHLSVSCKSPARVPTWDELGWCKRYFLGDRRALQVLPPAAEYVNDNPHCLNLYAPLERNPLPDFRAHVGETGRLSL
jgi:hypothetical protein